MSDEAILRYARSLRDRDEKLPRRDDTAIGRYAEQLRDREEGVAERFSIPRDVSPDQAGRANQLSRRTGLPADVVERNLPEVEQRWRGQQARSLMKRYPAIGSFLSDPRSAAVIGDDLHELAGVAKIFTERRMLPQFRRAPQVRLPSDAELDAADQSGGYLTPIGQEDAYRVAKYVRDIRQDVARSTADRAARTEDIGRIPEVQLGALKATAYSMLATPSQVIAWAATLMDKASPNAALERKLFGRSIEQGIAREFGSAAEAGYRKADSVRGRPLRSQLLQSVVSGIASAPLTAVQLALSRFGMPGIGAGVVAGTVGAESYRDATKAGISPLQATIYAATPVWIGYVAG